MRFDDLARRAGEDARARAEEGTSQDFAAFRRRRAMRSASFAVATAALALVAVVVGSWLTRDGEVAVDTTLPADLTTTTMTPTVSTTPPNELPPSGVLGAGWEELDAGAIAGRYRVAATWMEDSLFVFGGHVGYRQEPPSVSDYEQDAYVYDPAAEVWRTLDLPEQLCNFGRARAYWIGTRVVVWGQHGPGECDPVAVYDPADDSWQAIAPAFSSVAGPDSPAAWTGELLVFPTLGLAWDPATGGDVEMPTLDVATNSTSPLVAHWTGTDVVAIGSGGMYRWRPGEAGWTDLGHPPVPQIARDSEMTSGGLLVANYQMAAAWWTAADGWERKGDLPLRFYECYPDAVSAGGTPVVQMCSGLAIWDEVGGFWIPIPLEDVTGWSGGNLVGADDALYSVGPRFRRFQIERHDDGRISPPPTIPIGLMQFDLPDGFELAGSFAPDQDPEGFIPDDETVGVILRSSEGDECRISSTYGWNRDGYLLGAELVIARPGRTSLTAAIDSGSRLVIADQNGSDTVVVDCGDGGLGLASSIAQGLWSPWQDS